MPWPGLASNTDPRAPAPKLHPELAPPKRVTLSALVLGVNGVKSHGGLCVRAQRTAGVWLLDSSLAPSKAQSSFLLRLFSPHSPCLGGRAWDSGLALVSLSDLNEGGWMFAGVVTPCSNNPFLLPVSATDRATAQGGGERLRLVTKRHQQNINKAFDIYCHIEREKKKSKESAHVQELEVCLEPLKSTWKVKADPLTQQF